MTSAPIAARSPTHLLVAFATLLAGCSGSAAAPPPSPPVVDLAITPPPPPVASAPEAPEPSAEPVAPKAPPPPAEPTMAQRYAELSIACKGGFVDLRRALYSPSCQLGVGMRPPSLRDPTRDLEITFEAQPAKVKPGGRTTALVRLRNPAAEPVVVEFETDCHAGPLFEIQAYDRKGKRADDDDVVTGLLCQVRLVRVGLEPGGVAEARVDFEARKKPGDAAVAALVPRKVFAKGSYELRLELPLWMGQNVQFPTVKTTLEVGP